MYTILINKDKTLTTSVRTTLLKDTTTDELVFLLPVEGDLSDDSEETTVVSTTTYSPLLRYVVKSDGVLKTEVLGVDEELYKGRARFYLPRSSVFFRNRGMIEFWLDITATTVTTTTTTVIDEQTGEETTETTTETTSETWSTLSTTLFIEDNTGCPYHRNPDNTIRITRGDSLTINITLTDGDGYQYEPVLGDVVWFRVKKSASATEILIEKQIDIETLVLELVESDTETLAFGEYKYEIEVITNEQDHYTVIKNAPFIITEELH